MKNKQIALIALVVLTGLYFLAQIKLNQRKSQEGVLASSKNALGLSIAKEYLADQLHLNKKAFHDYLDLKAYDMVAIHSPKFPLSSYEQETLRSYVYQGGSLLLTAMTEADYERLNVYNFTPLTAKKMEKKEGDAWVKAAKDASFKNGQTKTIQWPKMNTIQHYSAIHWVEVLERKNTKTKVEKNKSSDQDLVHLVHDPEYLMQWSLGQGKVTVLLGVPPYANAMLQFKENQDFLKSLKVKHPTILWDVYHHYVKQAGIQDLLKDVQVLVPILGFVLFILFYFSMVPKKVIHEQEESDEFIPTYHGFYESLFSALFKNDKGREDAYAFFHQKTGELYGLKQDKLIKTGKMDEKEFILNWNKSVLALAEEFK
ncbi:hypothetical protein MRY82_02285 [bacterium]|nr:hypothetical protein [bacterium]